MTVALAQTPLYSWHDANGGRMVPFAGWSMPVQYTSIVDEHRATRRAATAFDVSHMGRLQFQGAGAARFLDRLLTRRVMGMPVGKIRYSTITNHAGGILDDVLVYHLQRRGESPFFALVVNAGNRGKIVSWIESHSDPAEDVVVLDHTTQTAMIAVQGPRALDFVQPLVGVALDKLDYYSGAVTTIGPAEGVVSRTGYTGEDGCELIIPAEAALGLWQILMGEGAAKGIKPAGLGARDTLRLEAAMPLYGHELSEQINPFQAGLGFAVNLKDRDFIGRDALVKLSTDTSLPRRVGLELSGRRVAREDQVILAGDSVVGRVTSGTFSPTLERPIAMGYVHPDVAEVGTELVVEIRGRPQSAQVVKLPFYSKTT